MQSSYNGGVAGSDMFTRSKGMTEKDDDLHMTFGDDQSSGEVHAQSEAV